MQNFAKNEVLIFCDDHGACIDRVPADGGVRRRPESAVRYVLSGVAEGRDSAGKRRRQLRVDEKAQSCAPENRMIVLPGREFEDGCDVLVL
jgi:hypothetical protein